MRIATLSILAVLLGSAGLALAAGSGASREDVKTPVPLVVYEADGTSHTYFFKCGNLSRDLATCQGGISVWENTNPLDGLQTTRQLVGVWHAPDEKLLS